MRRSSALIITLGAMSDGEDLGAVAGERLDLSAQLGDLGAIALVVDVALVLADRPYLGLDPGIST